MDRPVIIVVGLSHSYGPRRALERISLEVHPGEIFSCVGPNGGGKTTLFKILSTLIRPTAGSAGVCGHDLATEADGVRRSIGVVFQSPSVDGLLTVEENLQVHAALYGLNRRETAGRVSELLSALDLADRRADRVGVLSGGLRRRVEIAKALLHRPRVLLLDEASTGLDPDARLSLWAALSERRAADGMTVVMTTHLMEEAARCDRVAILDSGRIIARGTPAELSAEVGGDVIQVEASGLTALSGEIRSKFSIEAPVVDGVIRIERREGHEFIPRLVEAFPGRIDSVSLRKPTLEDVFTRLTGRRYKAGA